MADTIRIDTDTLDVIGTRFSRTFDSLYALMRSIAMARAEVDRVAPGLPGIARSVGSAQNRTSAAANRARALSAAVGQASRSMAALESSLARRSLSSGEGARTGGGGGDAGAGDVSGRIRELFRQVLERSKNRPLTPGADERVFDERGKYGGNQSDAANDYENYETYRRMVREHTGRELNDEDLRKYLRGMANEGCGYMAMVNVILKQYEGRPGDFERTFGFPMYDPATGDLNYNLLMVDLYSATDNHNRFLWWDTYSKYEDYSYKDDGSFIGYDPYTDTTRKGTNPGERNYRLEKYLGDHGVDAESVTKGRRAVTVDNYNEIARDSDVIIRINGPFYMIDSSGNPLGPRDGGHAMTVTGVETISVNGRPTKVFKVSSWGKVYYVNPSDPHGSMDFNVVTFK